MQEAKPTPRSRPLGLFADAFRAIRDFADRAQIPAGVPFVGGQGVADLFAAAQVPGGKNALLAGAAFEGYRRLAGEAEARAVQSRMGLNALQRQQLFPLDSYDVPVDQLIVRR